MVTRNSHLQKLHRAYLFAEIGKRTKAFLATHPTADLIPLGIGDTTEPIPKMIAQAMADAANALGTPEGYSGYDTSMGKEELRSKIASVIYKGRVSADEIFISDGCKPEIGRLQLLFGNDATIAVQDPSYPAYIASSVVAGKTGRYRPEDDHYEKITYMPCTVDNNFFPNLSQIPPADVLFFCSPNNPTGAAATRQQLQSLVDYATTNQSIIIYDSAYAGFIHSDTIPHSIFEIEGARNVAIETGSFSKFVGFTGVRLGWTVVPKELHFNDGTPVIDDWKQIISSCFNGASNIAQMGGIAALTPEGLQATKQLTHFYLENANILKEVIQAKGYPVYGGKHAPYLWMQLRNNSSWDAFDTFLHKGHLITTPGVGFGPSGEGFLRLSAFGHRSTIEMAAERLTKIL